jgi:hypothetical protein
MFMFFALLAALFGGAGAGVGFLGPANDGDIVIRQSPAFVTSHARQMQDVTSGGPSIDGGSAFARRTQDVTSGGPSM